MKKFGVILACCLLASLVATSVMAQEFQVAEEDKGDVLIFPVYAADGTGWDTKFTVINTSNTDCVVAKVVFRGEYYSQELLDFFIYLSPNDVWTAKAYNDNGTIKVYSDDDSCLSSQGVWADETPMDQPLTDRACDSEKFGYVTVFQTWNAALDSPGATVDKDLIFSEFEGASTGFDGEYVNSLVGRYEIRLPTLDLSAAENAVALKDYDVDTKLSLGVPTFLGQNAANAEMGDVEKELAKEEAYMPFYKGGNITAHLFTFPTKLSVVNSDCEVTDAEGDYWDQNTVGNDYCVAYGLKQYDLQENSPQSQDPIFSPVPPSEQKEFCYEFNASLATYAFQYEEGWAHYTFQLEGGLPGDADPETAYTSATGTDMYFTGVPVIPLVLSVGVDGLSLHSAAYEFGTVEEIVD